MPTDSYDEMIDKIVKEFEISDKEKISGYFGTTMYDILPGVTDDVFRCLYQSGKLRSLADKTNNEEIYQEIFTQLQQMLADILRIAPSAITPNTSFKKIVPFRKRAAVVRKLRRDFRHLLILGETSSLGCALLFCSFFVIPPVTMITLGFMLVSDFVMFSSTILMCFLSPFLTHHLFTKNCCDFQYQTIHDLVQKALEYKIMKQEYAKIGLRITQIIAENFDPDHMEINDLYISAVYQQVMENKENAFIDFDFGK